ncbi:acyltransferase [uncultured Cellulomonas sp.]|uniref:acyltransferase family protein n=1 Tax=uncultured Cellulomonas sp. TaxID=189682 RepID=UPI002614025D|nr:acyltransferase [uncultured Cellulomonas sp.]
MSHDNNLHALRLAAAVAVVVSHSFAVAGSAEPAPWFNPLGTTWGYLGVLVFFGISGYLITTSWEHDPSVRRYAAKRALRIVPGLAVAAAVTAWVLGPLLTTVPLGRYLSSAATYLYPPLTTLVFAPTPEPPGLFVANPRADLNASLWTIPVEVLCYGLLVVAARTRLLRSPLLPPLVVVVAVLGSPQLGDAHGLLRAAGVPLPAVGGAAIPVDEILLLGAAFFAGSLLRTWRRRLPLRPDVAVAVLVALVLLRDTAAGDAAAAVAFPYVVLTVGLACRRVPLGGVTRNDLSYGVYLFGYPVQQAVVVLTGTRDPGLVTVLTLVVVVPLAGLSWRYVEKPALRLKPRARSVTTPAAAASSSREPVDASAP